jgi:hypothetical protein
MTAAAHPRSARVGMVAGDSQQTSESGKVGLTLHKVDYRTNIGTSLI